MDILCTKSQVRDTRYAKKVFYKRGVSSLVEVSLSTMRFYNVHSDPACTQSVSHRERCRIRTRDQYSSVVHHKSQRNPEGRQGSLSNSANILREPSISEKRGPFFKYRLILKSNVSSIHTVCRIQRRQPAWRQK